MYINFGNLVLSFDEFDEIDSPELLLCIWLLTLHVHVHMYSVWFIQQVL